MEPEASKEQQANTPTNLLVLEPMTLRDTWHPWALAIFIIAMSLLSLLYSIVNHAVNCCVYL
jgi:hypothetical protein